MSVVNYRIVVILNVARDVYEHITVGTFIGSVQFISEIKKLKLAQIQTHSHLTLIHGTQNVS